MRRREKQIYVELCSIATWAQSRQFTSTIARRRRNRGKKGSKVPFANERERERDREQIPVENQIQQNVHGRIWQLIKNGEELRDRNTNATLLLAGGKVFIPCGYAINRLSRDTTTTAGG